MVSIATAVPALRAAGLIGIWNTDVTAGRSVLDDGAATLLAGHPGLAGEPLPLEVALGRVLQDDRGWVFERIRRARQTGGPFSAEFRVLTETGEVRWVLNRGSLTRDANGAMWGCGAYIDTTDTHRDPFISPASLDRDDDDPLIAAADRCLETHAALKRFAQPDLHRVCELLLTGIGRALARRQAG